MVMLQKIIKTIIYVRVHSNCYVLQIINIQFDATLPYFAFEI